MVRIEEKMEKLAERLDELSITLGRFSDKKIVLREKFDIKPLTMREQEVFLYLYTAKTGEHSSYRDIARTLGLTENLVMDYVTNLISKGVPLIKKYVNDKVYLALDEKFRQVQAKQNIIRLNPSIRRQLSNDLLSNNDI